MTSLSTFAAALVACLLVTGAPSGALAQDADLKIGIEEHEQQRAAEAAQAVSAQRAERQQRRASLRSQLLSQRQRMATARSEASQADTRQNQLNPMIAVQRGTVSGQESILQNCNIQKSYNPMVLCWAHESNLQASRNRLNELVNSYNAAVRQENTARRRASEAQNRINALEQQLSQVPSD